MLPRFDPRLSAQLDEVSNRPSAFDARFSYLLDWLIIQRDEGDHSIGLRLTIRAFERAIPPSAIVQPRPLQLEALR